MDCVWNYKAYEISVRRHEKGRQGDLEVHLIEQSRDEVGKLTRKFNEMIEQIRNLVKAF